LTKKIILLAGPTASGKSKLAIKLAKKIKGEIINADSMQVYKEFCTLSSQPSATEKHNVRHHLYGFITVKKYFSTGEWLKLVKKKIRTCFKKGITPILVGGTGLYFNVITQGISKIPNIANKKRLKVRDLYKKIGQKKFYEKLIKLDPLSKNKILPTDTQRIIRAYEVKLETKKSLYDWASNTKSEFLDCDIRKIYLDTPREQLLENIYKRTELMFKNKCVNEVKKFISLEVEKSLSANKLIGVKEITEYLKGSISLIQTKEFINIKTRQYAKRQNTWSRGQMKNWNKLYSKDLSSLTKKTLKLIS
jgi:tRNA dimethylallyltransferase